MLQRHSNELMLRLESVNNIGATEIRRDELKLWYGLDQRITVTVWRDISERWAEIVGEENPDLTLLVGDGDGVYILVWGEGLTPSEDAWFKDIRVLARRSGAPVEDA
ncbi:MAG: hypothetical protein ACTHLT_00610 [Devosia sp.]